MKYREHAMEISSQVQTLLSHPHEWVRLGASQFLGCIFASINPEHISNAISNNESSDENCILLFEDNTSYKVKSLTLDLCDQLQPLDLKEEFAEQIVKNLVYLARVLRHIPNDPKPKTEDEEGGVSLLWLARKLRKSVNIEIAQTPGRIVVRCAVLRWVAGVAIDLGGEGLLACPPLLHHMLAPVARETALASDNTPALRRLAKEVAALVKEQVKIIISSSAFTCLK